MGAAALRFLLFDNILVSNLFQDFIISSTYYLIWASNIQTNFAKYLLLSPIQTCNQVRDRRLNEIPTKVGGKAEFQHLDG